MVELMMYDEHSNKIMISNNDRHPKNVRQGTSYIGDSMTNTKDNMLSIIPSDISKSYVVSHKNRMYLVGQNHIYL